VTLTISFIAENALRAVLKPSEDEVSYRYQQRSMIFVADNHPAFEPDKARKLKRKHGKITRSPYTRLQEMLFEHKKEVTDKLLELTADWRREQSLKKVAEKDANGDMHMSDVRKDDLEDVSDLATQANNASVRFEGEDMDTMPNGAIKPRPGSLAAAPALKPTSPLRRSSRSPGSSSESPVRR